MIERLTKPRQNALNRLRQLMLEALAPYDAAVYLFGSCASGDLRHSSDIDVGILPRGPLPPSLFASLSAMIEESTIPYDVDLVDLGSVSSEFLAEVRRTGVPWRA